MINKVSLQQVVASLQRPQATSAAGAGTGFQLRRSQAQTPGSDGAAVVGFEQQVRQGVASVNPDDPRRRQRVLRVLVEASLLREFGEQMGADPSFHAVVDQVVSAMDEEPALSSTISLALDALLSPPRGS